jgi:hypothetical protein
LSGDGVVTLQRGENSSEWNPAGKALSLLVAPGEKASGVSKKSTKPIEKDRR